MLSRFGFKEVRQYNTFKGSDDCETICFPVTDEPDFPEELRAKAEELIEEGLRIFKAINIRTPVCAEMVLEPYIQIYFKRGTPFYHIQIDMFDDDYEGDYAEAATTEYIIDTDEPLYQIFKDYMMQQLEQNLFR